MKRGYFITFEGPDGSGKSTQLRLLANRLRHLGIGCVETREPGGTSISDQIRALLLDPANHQMCAASEVLLYAASRAQLVNEVIRPALVRGEIVLCDRFVDASIAYQGGGLGVAPDVVTLINEFATGGLKPDRTFLIDIDAEVGIRRVAAARRTEFAGLDRIERRTLDYHRRVRDTFREIARTAPDRYTVIDGKQPIEVISEEIWTFIRATFQLLY